MRAYVKRGMGECLYEWMQSTMVQDAIAEPIASIF